MPFEFKSRWKFDSGNKLLTEDDLQEFEAGLPATVAAQIERMIEADADLRLAQWNAAKTQAITDGGVWRVRESVNGRRRIIASATDDTNGGKIAVSNDYGATWTQVKQFTTGPSGAQGRVEAIQVLDDGELIVCARKSGAVATFHRTTGFASDPATATWAQVHQTAWPDTYPSGTYHGFAYDGADTIIAALYDAKTDFAATPDQAAVRVQRSTDRGTTWTTVFRLDTFLTGLGLDPDAHGYHIHSAAYDPYGDAFIVTYGDWSGSAGDCGAVISSDGGTTWTTLYRDTSYQSVGIIPMVDRILFLGDGGASSGVNSMARNADGTFGTIEKAYDPGWGVGKSTIGYGWHREDAPGAPVFIPLARLGGTSESSRMVATTDGEHFYEVFVDTNTHSDFTGMAFVVGPLANGKVVATSVGEAARFASGTAQFTWTP